MDQDCFISPKPNINLQLLNIHPFILADTVVRILILCPSTVTIEKIHNLAEQGNVHINDVMQG